MRNIQIQPYASPCGSLLLGSCEDKLCLCDWIRAERRHERVKCRLQRMLRADYKECTSDVIQEAARQLDEYFRQERRTFDVPLLMAGTDFQQQVWNQLAAIPYGETLSYAELARRVGRPKAMRAVANANGANAVSILIPCHRVIGADRSLTGYGGGLSVKKFLLCLEQADWLR